MATGLITMASDLRAEVLNANSGLEAESEGRASSEPNGLSPYMRYESGQPSRDGRGLVALLVEDRP